MARSSGGAFVGLDIGTQMIKVVEARGAGKNLQITAIGMEKTPPGAVQQGIISDPKELGAFIKKLLSKSGIGSKKSVSAAAGAAAVVVRVIEVPRMTPTELAETMKWEVERHIPFAANEVEMSYQAIDDPKAAADENNPNMEVLLAVAQRDMVRTHLETLQAAGLNPVAIDVEPLAVGRAMINLSMSDLLARNIAVVNIGASNTDVGIFKSGILRFPRTIPLAGDNFTRAISDHLGLPMEDAEDEKRDNAMIFMDLISAPAQSDFGAPGMDMGGGANTPFDIPMNTPFAEPISPVPPAMPASPFDMDDAPPQGMPTTTTTTAAPQGMAAAYDAPAAPVGGGASSFADNPFATPFPETTPDPEAGYSPDNPFGTPASSASAPVPDDPIARRRREIFDALLPILGEFSMELRRSIDYFRSRYPEEVIDQIILTGGSARLPNLDQFIQNDMGITTVIANPFADVKVTAKQMSAEYQAANAPAFAVAVGLATRDAVLGS